MQIDLDENELKIIIKYLMAIRILFVIAKKEYTELNKIIKKLKKS